ncbi:MAG: VWA domain-containing protein [Deltaproteobacteria bacterium]
MRLGAPWMLFLLALAPLVLVAWASLERWRDRRVERAGDKDLIDRLSEGPAHKQRRAVQAMLLAGSLLFMAFALARPQLGMRSEVRKARGMDVVVALDLSRSMLARDVVPSRLERARIELEDLIDRLPGDRIGLVGFTSIALPLCPLTVDHAALKLQLRSATPDDLPRGGTSIGDAIRAGRQMLESAPETGAARAIVIVTDGEEHEGEPEKLAEESEKAGIEVHVVGVGSRTGEPIPLSENGKVTGYLKDNQGRTVVSRLNEEMLSSIASAGSGLVALPGENGGLDLAPVRNHLATLKKAELEDRVVRIYEERYQWPLAVALLLLLLATVVRPTRRVARVVVKSLVVLLLFASTAEAAPFEKEDPDARAGTRALQDGKPEEAAKAYQRAIDRLGEDPRLLYDRALAEAAAGELDKSIDSLKSSMEASTDPKMRSQAAFALGNAYRQLKKYDDALKSYRRSIIEDPTNASARKNLEIARQQKIIQALQPKDENEDGEQSEDGDEKSDDENKENPDGGTDADAGTSDSSTQDSGSNDDQGDGGSDDKDGSSNSDGRDGGVQDAGASQPQPNEEASEEERSEQDVEEILDSLAEQEKALERKRKLERFRGKKVTKDW